MSPMPGCRPVRRRVQIKVKNKFGRRTGGVAGSAPCHASRIEQMQDELFVRHVGFSLPRGALTVVVALVHVRE